MLEVTCDREKGFRQETGLDKAVQQNRDAQHARPPRRWELAEADRLGVPASSMLSILVVLRGPKFRYCLVKQKLKNIRAESCLRSLVVYEDGPGQSRCTQGQHFAEASE